MAGSGVAAGGSAAGLDAAVRSTISTGGHGLAFSLLICLVSSANLGQLPVDVRDLLRPEAAVTVLHIQYLVEGPVEVVGDVSYLLVELFEGVAYNPPGWPNSTMNLRLHAGHVAGTVAVPSSLIRR